jgi:hypothetical protein
MKSQAMKKDSFLLNFILGVILMILLAVAAKAQDKPLAKNKKQNQESIKKKPITAEEAKVIYEQKNGNVDGEKRKSYSRKDIDDSIPSETVMSRETIKTADSSIATKSTTVINQSSRQPKAIYKGPQKNSSAVDVKPVSPLSNEPKFIEHIEIEIGSGNNDH